MDRLMMIYLDETNIRDVYAFPKSGSAQDTMMNSPAIVEENLLDELKIKLIKDDKD
jgi:aspartyl-tRNA synthetase